MMLPEMGLKCPNGQAQDFYGKVGEPPSPDFIAICETEQSLFSYVVVEWLMKPYYDFLYNPTRIFIYNVVGKPLPETQNQGMGRRTHDILVPGLEALLSCAYMACSVALSVNLSSQTDRLIPMSIMSLVFPFSVLFLSSKAKTIFVLCAA